jgi:predicted nucleic acid-binding protein
LSPNPGLAVDASAMVALVADDDNLGSWARRVVGRRRIAAPRLMVFEACNVLRRRQVHGALDAASATTLHGSPCAMRVQHWPHSRLATRAWELRDSVTYYDATYVALAELLDAL